MKNSWRIWFLCYSRRKHSRNILWHGNLVMENSHVRWASSFYFIIVLANLMNWNSCRVACVCMCVTLPSFKSHTKSPKIICCVVFRRQMKTYAFSASSTYGTISTWKSYATTFLWTYLIWFWTSKKKKQIILNEWQWFFISTDAIRICHNLSFAGKIFFSCSCRFDTRVLKYTQTNTETKCV